MKLLAGADIDGRIHLYVADGDSYRPMEVDDWLPCLEDCRAPTGEMLLVTLSRDPDVAQSGLCGCRIDDPPSCPEDEHPSP